MCEPATAIMAASAIVSASGAMTQAQGQKNQAEYASLVGANNAKLAEWQAQSVEEKGIRAGEAVGRNQAKVRATQKAALAANGLDLGEGSAAATLAQTDYFGLEDQRTTAQNASDQAWGVRRKGAEYTAEAAMQKSKADSINPFMSGATSLLGSAANVADKWSARNPGKSFSSIWGS
jgi:hypothetical protein